jgi:hypothetical protein
MLFWRLFFSALAIIIAANIVGQIIISAVRRRHRRESSENHD